MRHILIYFKILKKAQRLGLKVPKNYEDILNGYSNIKKPGNDKIIFTWFFGGNIPTLDANATLKGKILFNAEWAARVVLFDNEETLNAFKSTVGHELTHKDREITIERCYSSLDKLFIRRINEVRADFGAGQRMLNSQRNLVLDAVNYKRALNSRGRRLKFDPHPTWEQRYNYIKNYNFSRELIYKIADDMNYHNKAIIEKVCDYYEDINLAE